MGKSACFLTLVVVFLCSGVCWAQRDSSEFDGKPWEDVERKRGAIEDAILAGNITEGMVRSSSCLYEFRHTPAFKDVLT